MNLPLPQIKKKTIRVDKMTPEEMKAFMDRHGMSEAELAETLGVTIQAVTLWLKGQRGINLLTTRILRTFNKYPSLINEFTK